MWDVFVSEVRGVPLLGSRQRLHQWLTAVGFKGQRYSSQSCKSHPLGPSKPHSICINLTTPCLRFNAHEPLYFPPCCISLSLPLSFSVKHKYICIQKDKRFSFLPVALKRVRIIARVFWSLSIGKGFFLPAAFDFYFKIHID